MSGRRIHAGAPADVTTAMPRLVPLSPDPRRGFPRNALLLRDHLGVLHAYVNLCKHLPVPLDAGTGRFYSRDRMHLVCGTHGALFRPDDGMCIDGPCEGLALDRLEVIEEDGELYVIDPDG